MSKQKVCTTMGNQVREARQFLKNYGKRLMEGKTVYCCFNKDKDIIHLVNPHTHRWICDESKNIKDDCEAKDSLSLEDFLNNLIDELSLLLKQKRDLHKVWDLMGNEFEDQEVRICEKCLGILLGNLLRLLD
jgi:superfamily II helicase